MTHTHKTQIKPPQTVTNATKSLHKLHKLFLVYLLSMLHYPVRAESLNNL